MAFAAPVALLPRANIGAPLFPLASIPLACCVLTAVPTFHAN